jgi:RNA processing factor Prp31
LQKIDCLHNSAVMELMRGLRNQLTELMTGLASQDLAPMSLGLSHSLSRYKLKFSPEKVRLQLHCITLSHRFCASYLDITAFDLAFSSICV